MHLPMRLPIHLGVYGISLQHAFYRIQQHLITKLPPKSMKMNMYDSS